jgi:hypothetical protein
MRKSVLFIAIIAMAVTVFTSCASYRSTGRNGCESTKGYVGYGSTR